MAPFSKPETVLKQAEGLVSVGQTHAALQSLTEMFSSKRFRSTPLASLEPIMHRFVELCVDMRKGRTAKEGLMQYKNIAQNTSVQSIENVISRFVQLADAKVREAQEKAAVKVAVDVDDLEASETPESILLGAVSGDQNRDRTDRALVTPWLKFLWESYRTSLETLKNNARLEVIYQQIAQQAFKFCLKHNRKVEFRRLCETLRLHLSNVAKYSHQPHSINLSDPDTLQHHLDTRFAQLNTSVELELWQEAFRSVEDVHNLLTMAKKAPRPAMMANYYEKLTKIFLMSGNALYHAAAWGRYYAVVTGIGGKTDEELGKLAGQVLVSALAVPVGLQASLNAGEEPEEVKGKNSRLTALLGLNKTPTRESLLKDALSRDVLKLSPEPIKQLYHILQVTFDPLTLCSSIAPLLASLAAPPAPAPTTTEDATTPAPVVDTSETHPYAPYLPLLHRALLSRLLSQLSQVYSTITISHLLSLVDPIKEHYSGEQVQAYVMGCARRGELNLRVDHEKGSITFVDEAFIGGDVDHKGISIEGAVQASTNEMVRTRLGRVAGCLGKALVMIHGDTPKAADETPDQQETFKALVKAAEAERKALHLRLALVARRRELSSELSIRKEREEASRRAEASRREKEEETKRAKEEFRRKEIERAKKMNDNIRVEEAKKLAQQLVERGILKGLEIDTMENLNTDKLMTIQVEQLEKEKSHVQERLRLTHKRIDHIERAYRKEERPLLAQDYETQQTNDRTTFEHIQKTRLETSRISHEQDLETKTRLSRMMDDYMKRRDAVVAKRGEEFAKKKEAAKRKIEEEKTKRRKQVLAEREAEKVKKAEAERKRKEDEEEAERLEAARAAEEEQCRAEEEAAAAEVAAKAAEEAEKAAAARKQREEERAAAAEKARLQLQREEEAAARAEARLRGPVRPTPTAAAPVKAATGAPEPSVWRRPGAAPATPPRSESPALPPAKFPVGPGAGGGWRERQAAKLAAERAGGAAPAPAPAPTPAVAAATPPSKAEEPKDDDGFTPVKKDVWKPRRGGRP